MTKGKEELLLKKIDGKNGAAVVKTLLGGVFNSTYQPCNQKITLQSRFADDAHYSFLLRNFWHFDEWPVAAF